MFIVMNRIIKIVYFVQEIQCNLHEGLSKYFFGRKSDATKCIKFFALSAPPLFPFHCFPTFPSLSLLPFLFSSRFPHNLSVSLLLYSM